MRPTNLMSVATFFVLACAPPEPKASTQGALVPGLVACSGSSTCADSGVCTAYDVGDGGSFCAPKACDGLICPESWSCYCLWRNPPLCGCSRR